MTSFSFGYQREKTHTLSVQTKEGEGWYSGTVHEVQTEANIGIFGREEHSENAYIYDENDSSHTGILANEVITT